jgi:hypothetical protein
MFARLLVAIFFAENFNDKRFLFFENVLPAAILKPAI